MLEKRDLKTAVGRDEAEKGHSIDPFNLTLSSHGLKLKRDVTRTLQINVGSLCNQVCKHCHLDAGPGRTEVMGPDTVEAVVAYARRNRFEAIDVTGGAPEMNPQIQRILENLAPLTSRLMLRSNLTALHREERKPLLDLIASKRVVIVASLPSLNHTQTDAQRGKGVFDDNIEMLKTLNRMGYGRSDGLELDLVSNPTGAFMAPDQVQTEERFRRILKSRYGIVFNNLYNFANVPLGRFRKWLIATGNLNRYLEKLASAFNPCSVDGVMCRSLLSVSWNGLLYDCDFNLARGLPMGGKQMHIDDMKGMPKAGSPIATADHCYTCTAGAGFT